MKQIFNLDEQFRTSRRRYSIAMDKQINDTNNEMRNKIRMELVKIVFYTKIFDKLI